MWLWQTKSGRVQQWARTAGKHHSSRTSLGSPQLLARSHTTDNIASAQLGMQNLKRTSTKCAAAAALFRHCSSQVFHFLWLSSRCLAAVRQHEKGVFTTKLTTAGSRNKNKKKKVWFSWIYASALHPALGTSHTIQNNMSTMVTAISHFHLHP